MQPSSLHPSHSLNKHQCIHHRQGAMQTAPGPSARIPGWVSLAYRLSTRPGLHNYSIHKESVKTRSVESGHNQHVYRVAV